MNVEKFIDLLNRSEYDDVPPRINYLHNNVTGFSAPKLMYLINIAVSCMTPDEIYFEIGTYKGKTLLSALTGNPNRAVAVDNFSQFSDDPDMSYYNLIETLEDHGVDDRVSFINDTYRNIKHTDMTGPVGVFFYDGNHDSDITFDALELGCQFLSDDALIILDDISGAPIHGPGCWGGVLDFLKNHLDECAPIFIMYTNNFPFPDSDWHNGVVVLQWRKSRIDEERRKE